MCCRVHNNITWNQKTQLNTIWNQKKTQLKYNNIHIIEPYILRTLHSHCDNMESKIRLNIRNEEPYS